MKSFLELVEQKQQVEVHHVMTFGRMNPPTTGHLKLIDKVKEIAKQHKADHTVVASHTQDAKKNPLSAEQKVKHLQRYSPGTNFKTSSKEHPTFLQHAAELHKKGVTHLHMVAGSDRVAEYKEKLNKYNGTHKGALYNFKKIHVHSAGQRDPDSEGSEGMSGTKMREHAKNKNFAEFRKGVPAHVSDTHAKELMNHTRKGMGLNESYNRGLFKAIFVTGAPGSGKDIVIREAIAESKIVELNFIQSQDYLGDKQKLSEKTNDFRREAIRNRGPLIINGPADDKDKIAYIKEELEELGYDTMMIFVETTNEISKERNSLLAKMMMESIRNDKWLKSQQNTKYFQESFNDCITFDNTGNLDTKEEDIHLVYEKTNEFLDNGVNGETAEDWLNRRSNLSINLLFKENKNVKSPFKYIQENAPGQQLQRKLGKVDSVKDGDVKYNSSYTFKAYSEANGPKVEVLPQAKEPNFQKDKEKLKLKKFGDKSIVGSRVGSPSGVGSEWNTRTNGSGLTGGAGLGNQTYSESQEYSNASPASNTMPSGGSPNPLNSDYDTRGLRRFKKVKEAIDDPGAYDMGVGGTLGGASNKEPLVTPNDNKIRVTEILKKKKK